MHTNRLSRSMTRLPAVALAALIVGCGSSATSAPTSPMVSTTTTTVAATTPATVAPATTQAPDTTTTVPRYLRDLGICQNDASPQLAEQIGQGGSALATALQDCNIAASGVTRLHATGAAGLKAKDLSDALLAFLTTLEYAKVNVKAGVYNDSTKADVNQAVTALRAAITTYLG